MAKVFVAGATGVAGNAAVRALLREGHAVAGVTRTDTKAAELRSEGAEPVTVDLFDPAAIREAVDGYDAVVNLATKIPAPEKALLPGAWNENDRIRTQVSKNLVDACISGGVGRYVQESLGFVYRDAGDDWVDEDTPVDVPPHARSIIDAEAQVRRFGSFGAGVVLRFGQFYAAGTPHTQSMVATARRGLSPFVGPAEGFVALLHADDIGNAVVAAIQAPPGTYNVVDDEPLRRGELDEILARAVGRPRLHTVPTSLAKVGGSKIKMLMRSQRVSNRRLRSAGWEPTVPTAREGLPRVVGEMARSDA